MPSNRTIDAIKHQKLYLLGNPCAVIAAIVIEAKNEATPTESKEIHACL